VAAGADFFASKEIGVSRVVATKDVDKQEFDF